MKTAYKPNGKLIPINFLSDDGLTYAEKGMLVSLYCDEMPKDKELFNSLIIKGYIEKDKKEEWIVRNMPKRSNDIMIEEEIKEELPKKEKKPTLIDKCINEINYFTSDIELRKVLRDYLFLRVNPDKNSRLYDKKISTVYKFKSLLTALSGMRGNKVEIVKQSIAKEWAVFVDMETRDSTYSDTLTEEERNKLNRGTKF